MPTFKIKELEKRYGDLHRIIPYLANERGQVEAGRILGVSSATIHKWLKDNGYTYIRKNLYIRANDSLAASQKGAEQ